MPDKGAKKNFMPNGKVKFTVVFFATLTATFMLINWFNIVQSMLKMHQEIPGEIWN